MSESELEAEVDSELQEQVEASDAAEPTPLDAACRILSESTAAFEKLTAEHIDATLIGGLASARTAVLATIARAARSLRSMVP